MPNLKTASSVRRTATVEKQHMEKGKKSTKTVHAHIYPMMPRGYTAVQRAALRKFERELYAGMKVNVE
jgi:CRISPR/Cas system CSM-associated protein Csm2 small subunit